MYPIYICIYFYIFFFFYRTHFGTPARRKAGMRQNSECEVKDPLRKVQKTQMKSKGYVYEGKLQFPFVSNCHY